MPQYVGFQTFPNAPYQFQILVDGTMWSVVVTWNVSAQRWYLNFYNINGTWIATVPLTETLGSWSINALTFDPNRMIMMAALINPHKKKIGQVVSCFLIGSDIAALNVWHDCLIETPTSLSFPVASDPGVVNPPGALTSGFNLLAEYAVTTTLLFRNKIFEVYP